MMMCLGVFLFGSNFFGILWASWTWQQQEIENLFEKIMKENIPNVVKEMQREF